MDFRAVPAPVCWTTALLSSEAERHLAPIIPGPMGSNWEKNLWAWTRSEAAEMAQTLQAACHVRSEEGLEQFSLPQIKKQQQVQQGL